MANPKLKRKAKKSLRANNQLFHLIFACSLVALGSSLIFFATLSYGYGWQGPNELKSKAGQQDTVSQIQKPVKIYIPKLNRNLDVSDGYVENNRWTISSTGVSYLTTSGSVGQAGNVVIYGHNTRDVLGGLWRVQNGDIVEVSAADGNVYKYQIFERREIKPNEVDILTQTNDARLTIYTCSGFLDSARFVVVGKLVS